MVFGYATNETDNYLPLTESVSAGHPDKIADQIADAILDAVLAQDPYARSAVEVTTSTGDVSIFGELSTSAYVNVRQIAMDTIRDTAL
ncbi:hypothetical protein GQS40_09720|uniref:S-adenosylmethionine synthetase N-terminal domain-containing protein n=1 Tax=Leuconostoc lactis TaxID=1246 RepID=A0A6L7A847_LEULA|nr:hypothetical protein [Leuconostoc lactis]